MSCVNVTSQSKVRGAQFGIMSDGSHLLSVAPVKLPQQRKCPSCVCVGAREACLPLRNDNLHRTGSVKPPRSTRRLIVPSFVKPKQSTKQPLTLMHVHSRAPQLPQLDTTSPVTWGQEVAGRRGSQAGTHSVGFVDQSGRDIRSFDCHSTHRLEHTQCRCSEAAGEAVRRQAEAAPIVVPGSGPSPARHCQADGHSDARRTWEEAPSSQCRTSVWCRACDGDGPCNWSGD